MRIAYPCLLAALAWPSEALAAPGDVFVTESLGGSVVELGDGGDLSAAPRFATGLQQPTGICRGPEGHIYVVETLPGEVTIIDDGGDMTDVEPFAYGVPAIFGLWCDDERILTGLFVSGIGVVIDVSAGGFLPDVPADQLRVAMSPALTTAIVVDGTSMWALGGDVWDVSGGGDHTMDPAYAFGVAMVSGMLHDGMTLGGQFQGPGIYDFTAGGDLAGVTPWATLPDHGLNGVEAMVDASELGVFALIGNEVYEITGGGDLSLATPYATGLNAGLNGEETIAGAEGMLHHVCSTHDDCADGDLCNGDEQCVDNACVDPAGVLECDDADICTADGCDAASGCSNVAIAGCCHDDLDCEIDEVCDGETDECVPTEATSGDGTGTGTGTDTGAGTDADADADADADSAPETDSGSDTDDAPAAAGPAGCTCTSARCGSPLFGLLLFGSVFRGRRRRIAGNLTATSSHSSSGTGAGRRGR